MSSKHFSWLLIATVLLGALVLLLPGRTSKVSEFDQQVLLPGFAEQVNDADRVEVITAGNITVATLQRQDDTWVVAESGNYPADWPQLRELLAQLARAEIVEPKTSNPEYFSRLGVSDVASDDSQATLLRISGTGLDSAILVGNAAEGRAGQYVRVADGERAVLIDQTLKLPAGAKDWLQRDIVDISDAEVVEVEVTHPDGSVIRATKASADDADFALQDIPEGREVLSSWSVNSMANALANLQLDSVVPADTVDFSSATKFRLLTADGLEVVAEVAGVTAAADPTEVSDPTEAPTSNWLRLSARAYAPEPVVAEATEAGQIAEDEPAEVMAEDSAETSATDESAADEIETEDAVDAEQRAAEINRRVNGWAFEIPSYKADPMTRQMDDLLKALPDNPDAE